MISYDRRVRSSIVLVLVAACGAKAASRGDGALVAIGPDDQLIVVDVGSAAVTQVGAIGGQMPVGTIADHALVLSGGDGAQPPGIASSILEHASAWSLRALGARPIEAVSPDGAQVAIACGPGEAFDPSKLCVAALAAGSPNGAALDTAMDHPNVDAWTADGLIVSAVTGGERTIARLDPRSGARRELGRTPSSHALEVGRDGRTVAWIEPGGAGLQAAVASLDDLRAARRYPLGPGSEFGVFCRPLAARLICIVPPGGDGAASLLSIDRASGATTTLAHDAVAVMPAIAPDEHALVYAATSTGDTTRLVLVPLAGGAPRELAITPPRRLIPVGWLR